MEDSQEHTHINHLGNGLQPLINVSEAARLIGIYAEFEGTDEAIDLGFSTAEEAYREFEWVYDLTAGHSEEISETMLGLVTSGMVEGTYFGETVDAWRYGELMRDGLSSRVEWHLTAEAEAHLEEKFGSLGTE